jgi:biopolymer transport protein ExbD
MPDIKEGGVNVTPLIDVVMCLIIFFILVAKLGVSTGLDTTIDAPTTYLGVSIPDLGNTLTLNLYRKGMASEPLILVDLKGEKKKELALKDGNKYPLRAVLTDMKKELGDRFKVIINADKGTDTTPDPTTGNTRPPMTYEQIQLVLQECATAGVANVNFATKKATRTVTQ